ncbi:ABC transporter permease [Methylobacterium terricola]|uniref:ABC transporter permease n=1 Tax=Methylobacterium terricola TaxID=2583531 RepID=A0A5C4L6P9_9HYPH|nr:ABC transporter permease [Methylobacterium terricola]TNC07295.1 ABC transporter permease [Methylobacterium terricola]
MTASPLPGAAAPMPRRLRGEAAGALLAGLGAVTLALAVGAGLILATGRDPAAAYLALFGGALGSPDRIAFAVNKATPYVLTAVGVALCFRAKVINIGGEGQIALGGLAAAWVALSVPLPAAALVPVCLVAGAAAGAFWAGAAALIRLWRGVHEVLCTLLMNFIALLLVAEALKGDLGETGAGFPQTPLLPAASWLPRLTGAMHLGIGLAALAALLGWIYLQRTTFGFRLKLVGASRAAALYAGVSPARTLISVMLISGGLAGLAGSIEVLGVHRRLIEGFSNGLGFTAIGIALLAGANPLAALPAGLLFGLLEAGALAMQRQVGVPSSLVPIIQGLTMVFVLCALGLRARRGGA